MPPLRGYARCCLPKKRKADPSADFDARKLLMPMTFARRARTRDAGEFSRDDSGRLRLTRHARFHLEAKPQVSRLCEAAKAPDDFLNAAKLDFVARRKLILWVDFRRRKVDVRGEMTFAAGTIGGTT